MIRAAQDKKAGRRVLTVIRWPLGGIRTYLLYNYPLLTEAGYHFTFVGPADESFRKMQEELKAWKGIEFIEAPVSGQKCHLRRTVRRILRQHRHDLIHSQGMTAAVEATLANLGHGVPHVITSHDVFRADQFHGWRGGIKRATLSWLAYRADVLITVSKDAERNHLDYLGCPSPRRCRIETILNGIETDRFEYEPLARDSSLRRQLGISEDACLLGFLGRFMEQKGFLVLVDALERQFAAPGSEHVHLLAVGSGDYLREYQAEVASRPRLARRITFLPHTPHILPILRAIDLLVMPSLWEACPLLPMEAMCAGVPVLGSDCIGLREVLTKSPSPMVPAGNSPALAEALEKAATSPWKEAALAFAPVARQRFDVRVGAKRLVSLFDQFVT